MSSLRGSSLTPRPRRGLLLQVEGRHQEGAVSVSLRIILAELGLGLGPGAEPGAEPEGRSLVQGARWALIINVLGALARSRTKYSVSRDIRTVFCSILSYLCLYVGFRSYRVLERETEREAFRPVSYTSSETGHSSIGLQQQPAASSQESAV